MPSDAFIIAAKRTAVAPKGGVFSALAIHQLAAPVVNACIQSANFDPSNIDEIILSNAVGGGGNPARLAAIASDLPERVGGISIDRQCAGGLDAVILGSAMVRSGMANAVIAGGSESASRRPIRLKTDPNGGPAIEYARPPFTGQEIDPEMHTAAAQLADKLSINREMQDQYAIYSHQKALRADMSKEIVKLENSITDEFTRNIDLKLAKRAKQITGSLSHANTCVDADAAAFVLIVNAEIASRYPNAVKICEASQTAGSPQNPAFGADHAIMEVLDKSGAGIDDFNTIELMEAYAVQAISTCRKFNIRKATLNQSGGALARGHPIGASGAILAVRLYHQLQCQSGMGLAAIAAAGGLGSAVILKR